MYTDIITIEAAIERHPLKPDLSKIDLSTLPAEISRGMLAIAKLQIITHVINNDDNNLPDWDVDYNNKEQDKWFPWYIGGDNSGSGFRFHDTDYDWTSTFAVGGARLALKDEERAEHMGKYFSELYKELYLILK